MSTSRERVFGHLMRYERRSLMTSSITSPLASSPAPPAVGCPPAPAADGLDGAAPPEILRSPEIARDRPRSPEVLRSPEASTFCSSAPLRANAAAAV